MQRASKLMTAREAVERFLPPGCEEVAVGGMHMHNNPMALVRETVRQGVGMKRLVTSPSACINADMLVGAGLVEEILTSYVGFEHLGLAPNYRRAVESGRVRLLECDEPFLVYGFLAGAGGLPFVPYPPGLELSDIRRVNPDYYRSAVDPYTGRSVMTAKPITPDVALIHCQVADRYGNAAFHGSIFTDRQMAFAARTVIVQAEKVVDGPLRAPPGSSIPGFLVSAVVEAPFGCHPTSSHGHYSYDEEHLSQYLKRSRDDEGFRGYLEQFITGTRTEEEYQEAVGGAGRLRLLSGERGEPS